LELLGVEVRCEQVYGHRIAFLGRWTTLRHFILALAGRVRKAWKAMLVIFYQEKMNELKQVSNEGNYQSFPERFRLASEKYFFKKVEYGPNLPVV